MLTNHFRWNMNLSDHFVIIHSVSGTIDLIKDAPLVSFVHCLNSHQSLVCTITHDGHNGAFSVFPNFSLSINPVADQLIAIIFNENSSRLVERQAQRQDRCLSIKLCCC